MSSHLASARGRGRQPQLHQEGAGRAPGRQGGQGGAGAQAQAAAEHHARSSRAVGGAAGALMGGGNQAEGEAAVGMGQSLGAEGVVVVRVPPLRGHLARHHQHEAAEIQADGRLGLEGSSSLVDVDSE
jgi:hypothetical protein